MPESMALRASRWLPPHSLLPLMLKTAGAAEVAFSSNLIFSY